MVDLRFKRCRCVDEHNVNKQRVIVRNTTRQLLRVEGITTVSTRMFSTFSVAATQKRSSSHSPTSRPAGQMNSSTDEWSAASRWRYVTGW
jgi:hypothetical protein